MPILVRVTQGPWRALLLFAGLAQGCALDFNSFEDANRVVPPRDAADPVDGSVDPMDVQTPPADDGVVVPPEGEVTICNEAALTGVTRVRVMNVRQVGVRVCVIPPGGAPEVLRPGGYTGTAPVPARAVFAAPGPISSSVVSFVVINEARDCDAYAETDVLVTTPVYALTPGATYTLVVYSVDNTTSATQLERDVTCTSTMGPVIRGINVAGSVADLGFKDETTGPALYPFLGVSSVDRSLSARVNRGYDRLPQRDRYPVRFANGRVSTDRTFGVMAGNSASWVWVPSPLTSAALGFYLCPETEREGQGYTTCMGPPVIINDGATR